MSKRRIAVALATLMAGLIVLSGCGGSGSDTNANAAPAVANLKQVAQAKVDGYSDPESAKYPGPSKAFSPGTGRTAVMACGFAALVCKQQADFAVAAVKAMGWQTPPAFDGAFSPQVQAGFVDRAVQEKLDGIILVSVDVNGIKASIDRAIAAKMPIMCTACVSGSYNGKGVTDVTVSFEEQGEIAAWKVLADKGADAKVVTSYDPAFTSSVDRTTGFTKIMKANCGQCAFEAETFPSVDITKPGPPDYTAMLASHPAGKINHFQATYDGLATAAAKTNASTSRKDITVGGYDGSPEALSAMISQNPPVEFTIGQPYTYFEWAAADLLARAKAGIEPWTDADKMPNILITRDTAATYLAGNPKGSAFPAPQGDWQGAFLKLWGKS